MEGDLVYGAKKVAQLVLPVILGVGSAIGTVLAMTPSSPVHPVDSANTKSDAVSIGLELESSQHAQHGRTANLRLSAIEARVNRIQENGRASDSNDQAEEEDVSPEQLSPEQLEQEVQAFVDQSNAEFAADTFDNAWSDQATDDLAQGLGALSAHWGAEVSNAECRTTLCRAELEWDNCKEAQRTRGSIASAQIKGLNCTRTVVANVGEPGETSCGATLFLDCSRQRAGLADVIE